MRISIFLIDSKRCLMVTSFLGSATMGLAIEESSEMFRKGKCIFGLWKRIIIFEG
jgi:hypothetical protein